MTNELSYLNEGKKWDNTDSIQHVINDLNTKENKIVTLCLSGNTMGVKAAENLIVPLSKQTSLKTILWNDIFTGRKKDEIAASLLSLSLGLTRAQVNLVELDLSDNAFGPNGIVGVTNLIASECCYTLKVLKMNNQGLGHQGCKALVKAMATARNDSNKKGLNLEIFMAGRNRLENAGMAMLCEVFGDGMSSLRELSLPQNGIGLPDISGIEDLIVSIRNHKDLRILNISDNNIKHGGIELLTHVIPEFANLEELYIDDCLLKKKGVEIFSLLMEDKTICPNLKVISLAGNEMKSSAAMTLINAVVEGKPGIKKIHLEENEIPRNCIVEIKKLLANFDKEHILEDDFETTSVYENEYDYSDDDSLDSDENKKYNDNSDDSNEVDVDDDKSNDSIDEMSKISIDDTNDNSKNINIHFSSPTNKPRNAFEISMPLKDPISESTKPDIFGKNLFSKPASLNPPTALVNSALFSSIKPESSSTLPSVPISSSGLFGNNTLTSTSSLFSAMFSSPNPSSTMFPSLIHVSTKTPIPSSAQTSGSYVSHQISSGSSLPNTSGIAPRAHPGSFSTEFPGAFSTSKADFQYSGSEFSNSSRQCPIKSDVVSSVFSTSAGPPAMHIGGLFSVPPPGYNMIQSAALVSAPVTESRPFVFTSRSGGMQSANPFLTSTSTNVPFSTTHGRLFTTLTTTSVPFPFKSVGIIPPTQTKSQTSSTKDGGLYSTASTTSSPFSFKSVASSSTSEISSAKTSALFSMPNTISSPFSFKSSDLFTVQSTTSKASSIKTGVLFPTSLTTAEPSSTKSDGLFSTTISKSIPSSNKSSGLFTVPMTTSETSSIKTGGLFSTSTTTSAPISFKAGGLFAAPSTASEHTSSKSGGLFSIPISKSESSSYKSGGFFPVPLTTSESSNKSGGLFSTPILKSEPSSTKFGGFFPVPLTTSEYSSNKSGGLFSTPITTSAPIAFKAGGLFAAPSTTSEYTSSKSGGLFSTPISKSEPFPTKSGGLFPVPLTTSESSSNKSGGLFSTPITTSVPSLFKSDSLFSAPTTTSGPFTSKLFNSLAASSLSSQCPTRDARSSFFSSSFGDSTCTKTFTSKTPINVFSSAPINLFFSATSAKETSKVSKSNVTETKPFSFLAAAKSETMSDKLKNGIISCMKSDSIMAINKSELKTVEDCGHDVRLDNEMKNLAKSHPEISVRVGLYLCEDLRTMSLGLAIIAYLLTSTEKRSESINAILVELNCIKCEEKGFVSFSKINPLLPAKVMMEILRTQSLSAEIYVTLRTVLTTLKKTKTDEIEDLLQYLDGLQLAN